jgi:hypothetical protein
MTCDHNSINAIDSRCGVATGSIYTAPDLFNILHSFLLEVFLERVHYFVET